MTDDDRAIHALLDLAAAGAVGEPPIGELMAAGRTRARRRRAAELATVAVTVVIVVLGVLAAVTRGSGHGATRPAHSLTFVPGPSADRLANGSWEVVAPVAAFGGTAVGSNQDDPGPGGGAVWDGSGIVYAGPSPQTGLLELLSYDPQANQWTILPAPPEQVGPDPAMFGGHDQLALVSRQTGATVSWQPSAKRWTTLPTLPAKDVISLTWTGSRILAVTVGYTPLHGHQVDTFHPAHAFTLGPQRWDQLPDLPRPATGSIVEAAGGLYNGTVYLMTASVLLHGPALHAPDIGAMRLLRLGPRGWSSVPGTAGLPKSNFTVNTLNGAILVSGSACTSDTNCLAKVAALIRPGATAGVTVLHPPSGTSAADFEVTGGGSTVAVSGTSYWLYDLTTAKWLKGPQRPATRFNAGASWTPYGVVSNGALLRPSPAPSGH
jgi:hypothetical protein